MTDTPFLAVVIPVWNEQGHIADTMHTVINYLARQEYSSYVLVVDDGSTDDTASMVQSFIASHTCQPTIQLIENDHCGKGYAVRTGMLNARAKYIVFTDADLATPIFEVGKMIGALESGCDVAIGTREGIGAQRIGEPLIRHLMGRMFNLLVQLLAGLRFQDTQCGFKGFRYQVAQDLFSRVQLYGEAAREIKGGAVTGFDVEVLYLAVQLGYRIDEIPVRWQYGMESRVRLLIDSVRMLRDVLRVRRLARRGIYDLTT